MHRKTQRAVDDWWISWLFYHEATKQRRGTRLFLRGTPCDSVVENIFSKRRNDRIVIQRTGRLFLDWADVARGRESEIRLNVQTRAGEFQDCVLAMNKDGEGEGKRQRHCCAGRNHVRMGYHGFAASDRCQGHCPRPTTAESHNEPPGVSRRVGRAGWTYRKASPRGRGR